jgi:hypothetical protein
MKLNSTAVDDGFSGSLRAGEKRSQKRTTTFNGQADSVTLVAYRAANQMARVGAFKHCRSNQRAGACR